MQLKFACILNLAVMCRMQSLCMTNGQLTGLWMYFAIQGKGNESLAEAVVPQLTSLFLL